MATFAKLMAGTAGAIVVSSCLQGCGGSSGAGGSTEPASSTPLSTTTTNTPKARTPAASAKEVVERLNRQFYAYDPEDATSELGVTLSWYNHQTSWYNDLECAEWYNPVLQKKSECNAKKGAPADCMLEARLNNHKIMLTETGGLASANEHNLAIVVDQTQVQTSLLRCSYIWDGATSGKRNVGCGNGGFGGCSSAASAFQNKCGTPRAHTCTYNDAEIKKGACANYPGGDSQHPLPVESLQTSCYLPGPAVTYHGQEEWEPATDAVKTGSLRENVNFRFNNQDGNTTDNQFAKLGQPNTLVLDLRLLMQKIWEDPAVVVPAFVYVKEPESKGTSGQQRTEIAKTSATTARDEFCQVNDLGEGCIPVIRINADVDARKSEKTPIFEADEEELAQTETAAIV